MEFAAGFLFGCAAGGLVAGVWGHTVYRQVIERFTTDGPGVKIVDTGSGNRVAMVEIDG